MNLSAIMPVIVKALPRIMMARDKEKVVKEIAADLATPENVEQLLAGIIAKVMEKEAADNCQYMLQAKRIGDDIRIDLYRKPADGNRFEYYRSYNKATIHTLIKNSLNEPTEQTA